MSYITLSENEIAKKFKEIESTEETTEAGRTYSINGKKYASVTTMLGKTADKTFLTEWKKRVGEEAAKEITAKAAKRGTQLHKDVENYFLSGKVADSSYFSNIRPLLNLVVPLVQEKVLYSDTLGVAGRVDCIGLFDGVPSIIDYKTANYIKRQEWITDYFLQCTCYSLCVEEMIGEKVSQLVVLMATESDKKAFVVNRKDYFPALAQRIKQFKSLS